MIKTFIRFTSISIFVVGAALAQSEGLSTENMIEQLKPKPQRLTRSLVVERAPAQSTNQVIQTQQEIVTLPVVAKPQLSMNILFDLNSARVKAESQISLSRLAEALKSEALANSRFSVEGHTDAKGSPELNMRLSRMRAESVCDFLVSKGVSKDRLQASGKGFSELANPSEPYSYENRRVKIINLD